MQTGRILFTCSSALVMFIITLLSGGTTLEETGGENDTSRLMVQSYSVCLGGSLWAMWTGNNRLPVW